MTVQLVVPVSPSAPACCVLCRSVAYFWPSFDARATVDPSLLVSYLTCPLSSFFFLLIFILDQSMRT